MGKKSNKGDKQFTTSIDADRIRGLFLESLGTVIESLGELEHGTRLNKINKMNRLGLDRTYIPSEFSSSSVRAKMAASGVAI